MKKNTIAALILVAFAASAQAQSSVTIYGLADAGIVSESGAKAGTTTKVSSGVGATSRLGFRGTEDLGDGLSAIYTLEAGYKLDTGEVDATGALFNRQAYVGLRSKDAGTLTLGRQYTPMYNALSQVADPFGAGYAGSAKNLMPSAGADTRTSNTVLYATPVVSGFNAEFAYSMGEQAGSSQAGRQVGGALIYSNGPLNARLTYNNRNNDVVATNVNLDSGRNILLAANYDFKVVKAYFAYGQDKGVNSSPLPTTTNTFGYTTTPRASTDSTDLLIGATVPVTAAGTLMASYIRKDDKTVYNQDANQWAIGYTQNLSKRTLAYIAYGKIKNKNGASYTVGNAAETGTGDKAFNLGMRHSF